MDKYKKYYNIILFCIVLVVILYIAIYKYVILTIQEREKTEIQSQKVAKIYNTKKMEVARIEERKKKNINRLSEIDKKIYAPKFSFTNDETIFFEAYNDIIELIKNNHIKIKSIDYKQVLNNDPFVEFGNNAYFVCDIELELISTYTQMNTFLENFLQYSYFIKINNLNVKPHFRDKTQLITKLSLRFYSKLEPNLEEVEEIVSQENKNNK